MCVGMHVGIYRVTIFTANSERNSDGRKTIFSQLFLNYQSYLQTVSEKKFSFDLKLPVIDMFLLKNQDRNPFFSVI